MNIDEEAAKVAGPHHTCEDDWYSCPLSDEGCCNSAIPKDKCTCGVSTLTKDVVAFGRRCAEAMRDECVKEAENRAQYYKNTLAVNPLARGFQANEATGCAEAISRLEVK